MLRIKIWILLPALTLLVPLAGFYFFSHFLVAFVGAHRVDP